MSIVIEIFHLLCNLQICYISHHSGNHPIVLTAMVYASHKNRRQNP